MAIAKEIRTKIRSIKNTQKITRAMEMVAASKMRKAQERMFHARPYAIKIRKVIGHLAKSHPEYHHPFLVARDIRRVGFIIVTSDRGLCGGLNMNLFKATVMEMKEWRDKGCEISLCLIGSKAENFFKRHGGKVLAMTSKLGDAPTANSLVGAVKVMLDAYKENKIDALFLISNEFINSMTQRPRSLQLLPLLPTESPEIGKHWDYIYEPDAPELLDALLENYIESQVYQGVIENIACEQAARMVAMKSASDNAGELINDLQLVYNKARQAAITQELAEIVGGAAAV
ncbi:MAG: F0F1 ATP synthase subunit gamma [Gammaproteobacteria bacterium]|nr:F0F1 ATP synthase subunit gamma [Gammaproteobacteria bacterium]